ncbi:MAG TPA: hypothetical protein VE825_16435 [Terriglobales bacterium]|jgi:hypothetical protein|nr:hypothetical protein [Terriglobales bacterium]
MRLLQRVKARSTLATLILVTCSLPLPAQTAPAAAAGSSPATQVRDGQHDFEPLLGGWRYHLKRRLNPLTGSTTWVDFDGTGICYLVWDGRAELDTIEVDGSGGHIEGLTLRLYNPQSRQWSLYWSNARIGSVDPPQIGEFKDGHGDFYATDTPLGRSILVRFDWSRTTTSAPHFEQAFSEDGGNTWEVNWITDQTRLPTAEAENAVPVANAKPAEQHDFDFEFGSWKAHIRRLAHPLSGQNDWVDLDGTSTVRKIWNGRANLGELEVGNATTHLEGLSLRLYNPKSRQWGIYWANSAEGRLGPAMVGGFKDGRGEFYDHEMFQGKAVFVRFIFSDITPASFHFEQAFSQDGGRTWETNWIASFSREKP